MNIILIIISIICNSFLPITTIPIFLYAYSKYDYFAFLILVIAALCAITTQYSLGYFTNLKWFKWFLYKRFKKLNYKKYFHSIKYLSIFDLLLLRSTIPFSETFINISCGYLKVNLFKVFAFNFIFFLPFQIIYFYSSRNIDILNKMFKYLGLDITSSTFFSILTITMFLILIFRFSKRFLKTKRNLLM